MISKLATGKINPKEVVQLKNSLEALIPIKQIALESQNEALTAIGQALDTCDALRTKIKEVLNEEAPVQLTKGNVIAPEYSNELDELRNVAFAG